MATQWSLRRFQFGTRELLRLTFLIALMIGCVRFSMAADDDGNTALSLAGFAAGLVAAFAAAGALRQRAAFGAVVGLLVIGVMGMNANLGSGPEPTLAAFLGALPGSDALGTSRS